MIELTRLNGTPMVLNSDLIKTAEASPDTMLTLINGEKLIVREELRRDGGARPRLPRAPVGLGRQAAAILWRTAARCLAHQPGRFRPASATSAARRRWTLERRLKV